MKLADRESVKLVELKAPGLSRGDLELLRGPMQNKKLFPLIRAQNQREMIWTRLSSIEDPIPTIHTLFEDVKYLRPLQRAIRKLLPSDFKGTIRKALRRAFTGTHQEGGVFKVQTGAQKFTFCTGSVEDQVWYGILHLWLYAMRHFDRLVGECPKKEEKQALPAPQKPSSLLWHKFGLLADTLGFATKEIKILKQKNPDAEVAYAALLEARDPDYFTYDESFVLRHLRRMKRMFDTAIEKPDPGGQPTLLVDGPGEAVSRRCGRIFENAHSRTRKYLFLRSIYEPTIGEGDGISSFFVRRSVFFAFFGRPPKNSLFEQQGGNPPSPDLEDVMQVDYDHATTSSDRSTSSSPKSTTSEDSASTSAISEDTTSAVQTPVPPGTTQADPAEGPSQLTWDMNPLVQESHMIAQPQASESQMMVGPQMPENQIIVRPQTPENQIIVRPQTPENQIIVRPQTPENQIIRPQTPENQMVLHQTPESQMITPIEPPSRARMRLTREEEEPPADVFLRGKRRKLRQNEDINASEHMVIIMPLFRVMLIASRRASIHGTNTAIPKIGYPSYFVSRVAS